MKTRTIEDAIELAVARHKGQVDKQNVPYILHPLRVMREVMGMDMSLEGQRLGMVAVLHDVVEDTSVTLDELLGLGYPTDVVEAIDAVTKREGEKYLDFVRRAKVNRMGRVVKRFDILDNRNRIPRAFNSRWWQKLQTKYSISLAILDDDYDWLKINAELIAGFEAQ